MNQKLSISLPDEMVDAIEKQVQSGSFASTSEVLRTAVQHWLKDEEEHAAWLADVRARIDASINDPRPSVSADEVQSRIDGFLKNHRPADG